MKTDLLTGTLVATLFAATSSAFETVKQQISDNFAQAEVQHTVTAIIGVLEPCVDSTTQELITCPSGQFIWRHEYDLNLDCPCRYEMRHCDNEFEEFDTLTGECVCVERPCPDNHYWDFNNCGCACILTHDCPEADPQTGKALIWDRERCECICEPEESENPNYTWNVATCQLECII